MLPAFISCLGRLPAGLQSVAMPWELSEAVAAGSFPIGVDDSASVSSSVVVDGPVHIGRDCVVGPGVVLRDGVWLDDGVRIGPNCEIKSTVVFVGTAIAHLNYVGNSVIGQEVNIEAGAVLANHWNERADRRIQVLFRGEVVTAGVDKFGALVGDRARIGANAVTSPGTLLEPGTVVPRLGLVDQDPGTP